MDYVASYHRLACRLGHHWHRVYRDWLNRHVCPRCPDDSPPPQGHPSSQRQSWSIRAPWEHGKGCSSSEVEPAPYLGPGVCPGFSLAGRASPANAVERNLDRTAGDLAVWSVAPLNCTANLNRFGAPCDSRAWLKTREINALISL